jgi:Prolipoprotein diacylglyceryl transferase
MPRSFSSTTASPALRIPSVTRTPRGHRRFRFLAWLWAACVAISCITTGMHSIADVLAGALAFVFIARMPHIWTAILRVAEAIANSWQEWRIGLVRIINHGAFAGAGALIGMLLIEALLGPQSLWIAPVVFVCIMAGAALWAQWVEGSPALLRPLGFYGGVLGGVIGAIFAMRCGINFWLTLAAIAIASPWIQSFGRLRCLAQGCCHGQPTQSAAGIRYTHPRSRVCRITRFTGTPLHPTPVYSILWNIIVAAVLLRLLQLHCLSTVICGIYLVLSSLGRFVEEAYRGEPQTRTVAGLRLYQLIAAGLAVAGAATMTIRGSPMPPIHPLSTAAIGIAIACGLLTWFITGVDFPESSRRFARLT